MTFNYLEKISLSDPTHMMNVADLIACDVETPRIDGGYSIKKS